MIDGYEVTEHLSRGDSLDVYEVWSAERGCSCVLKTLRPDKLDHERARTRLLREGALLQRLTHPHLVRAYETIPGPVPAVILETLDGVTLERLLERRRRLRGDEVAALAEQLCSVVGYLHRQGVLHLDLKPANMISDGGRLKLIDLSLARGPGTVPRGFGTHGYMPPEQRSGGEVSTASDVWGVATVMREVLGRRAPAALADATATEPARRPSLGALATALA